MNLSQSKVKKYNKQYFFGVKYQFVMMINEWTGFFFLLNTYSWIVIATLNCLLSLSLKKKKNCPEAKCCNGNWQHSSWSNTLSSSYLAIDGQMINQTSVADLKLLLLPVLEGDSLTGSLFIAFLIFATRSCRNRKQNINREREM